MTSLFFLAPDLSRFPDLSLKKIFRVPRAPQPQEEQERRHCYRARTCAETMEGVPPQGSRPVPPPGRQAEGCHLQEDCRPHKPEAEIRRLR